MTQKHLHFTLDEFAQRLTDLRAEMAAQNLDAMLLFAQESMYWLTGYDTFGYCFFQCMIVRPDAPTVLLTRSADLRQAQFTSILPDDSIHIWLDSAEANPAEDLARLLDYLGLGAAPRIGVEYDTHGLTAHNYRRLVGAVASDRLVDASAVVPGLRLIKSPAEIAHIRKAAALADAGLFAAHAAARPGAAESDVLAALQNAILSEGGDFSANEPIIGSGPGALLCRYYSGRRVLDAQDQLTLEHAGVWRHYHVALMRTLIIGDPAPRHMDLHSTGRDALLACEDALRPGAAMGDVFDAHAKIMDSAHLSQHRLNACGYSLGARFTPSWMEPQMFYAGAPTIIQPGMVFFLHMILMDSDSGAAFCLGRTSLVTESGSEPLSAAPLDLKLS